MKESQNRTLALYDLLWANACPTEEIAGILGKKNMADLEARHDQLLMRRCILEEDVIVRLRRNILSAMSGIDISEENEGFFECLLTPDEEEDLNSILLDLWALYENHSLDLAQVGTVVKRVGG